MATSGYTTAVAVLELAWDFADAPTRRRIDAAIARADGPTVCVDGLTLDQAITLMRICESVEDAMASAAQLAR